MGSQGEIFLPKLLYFPGQNCGFRFELLYSERKGQKQHFRKYSSPGRPLMSARKTVDRSKNWWNISKGLKISNDNWWDHTSNLPISQGVPLGSAYWLRTVIDRTTPKIAGFFHGGLGGPDTSHGGIKHKEAWLQVPVSKRGIKEKITTSILHKGSSAPSTQWELHLLMIDRGRLSGLMITGRNDAPRFNI